MLKVYIFKSYISRCCHTWSPWLGASQPPNPTRPCSSTSIPVSYVWVEHMWLAAVDCFREAMRLERFVVSCSTTALEYLEGSQQTVPAKLCFLDWVIQYSYAIFKIISLFSHVCGDQRPIWITFSGWEEPYFFETWYLAVMIGTTVASDFFTLLLGIIKFRSSGWTMSWLVFMSTWHNLGWPVGMSLVAFPWVM